MMRLILETDIPSAFAMVVWVNPPLYARTIPLSRSLALFAACCSKPASGTGPLFRKQLVWSTMPA
jgi:hypothetical protein